MMEGAVSKEYAPKQFLRQADNALLGQYFTARHRLTDITFDERDETDVDTVNDAWHAQPGDVREEIERDFRDIYELASADGTRTLIEEGRFHHLDLSDDLEACEGFLNKAFWVFLHQPRLFDVALVMNRSDHLNRRYWRKRVDLPRAEPDVSSAALGQLQRAMAAYFRENQGRGKHCHVDTYLRGDRHHYFFAYPEDYADTFIGYSSDGRFERRAQKPAFEVVFIYDPVDGALDLYAQGGRAVNEDLQRIFVRTILHNDLPDDTGRGRVYDLNRLKHRRFAFPTDPADRIREVRIKELRFSLLGTRRRITYEVDPLGPTDEIYDLIEMSLADSRLPLATVNVFSAVLQMRFDTAGRNGRPTKTVTFRVSYPDSCNLRDRPEHLVAKKYVKEWGLQHVRPAL